MTTQLIDLEKVIKSSLNIKIQSSIIKFNQLTIEVEIKDITSSILFLKNNVPNDKIEITEKIPTEIHAEGTCTYIILTLSLCI